MALAQNLLGGLASYYTYGLVGQKPGGGFGIAPGGIANALKQYGANQIGAGALGAGSGLGAGEMEAGQQGPWGGALPNRAEAWGYGTPVEAPQAPTGTRATQAPVIPSTPLSNQEIGMLGANGVVGPSMMGSLMDYYGGPY